MRGGKHVISYVAAIVFSLVYIVLSLRLEYFSAKIVPLIIGGIVIFLAVIGLIR